MGRGEIIRVTMEVCKFDYEDDRISIIDYFMKGRRKEMPNSKVPVLVVNENKKMD